MRVTVFGSGYVGLVTGACLAEVGHEVMCIDVDAEKITRLKQGIMPIHEPGLEEMVIRNQKAGRLHFTLSAEEGVAFGLFQFIAVGTPPDEDGSADLRYVLAVAQSIGQHMQNERIIINKSTVPVGTADKVKQTIAKTLQSRGVSIDYSVVSNPEFLKEGDAIKDFMRPDRIIIGSSSSKATEAMRQLYAPFSRNHDKIITMDIRSAELTKYAANAMLATKISFMNELANLAERLGADIEMVRVGIGSDPRIGYHFIYPGCGYGGSCFPKDVKALIATAKQQDFFPELLEAVEAVNDRQKNRLFTKIFDHFQGNIAGKTFALWGLAFKPNTDDMREAPSRNLLEALWQAGAKVQAYDPVAFREAERIYGRREDFKICTSATEALTNADALAIVTEWIEFRSPNIEAFQSQLKQPVIFDGRNLYDPEYLAQAGITYYSIGRLQSGSEAFRKKI
jgi:UDPglucose 6-dehydrogenase